MAVAGIRQAEAPDAPGMSAVLRPILRSWQSARRGDTDHVLAHYIHHPDRVSCVVAVTARGQVLGFQSLKRAGPGNPYDLPSGWGIIGTYVDMGCPRAGVGQRLFSATRQAALDAGLRQIDATIGSESLAAQQYYAAMGFVTWRRLPGAVGKVLRLG